MYDFEMPPVFDPQEALDRVWQHFVVEKQPPGAEVSSGHCTLVASNGCRCAIGLCAGSLIDSRHFLGEAWFTRCAETDQAFFFALRTAHDRSANAGRAGLLRPIEDFQRLIEPALRNVAYDYNLDIPEPTNV